MTDTTDITDATESAVEGSKSSTHKGEARASDELVRAALSEVYDPEIGIDIVSLGLIYGTHLDDSGMLTIDMTLTTPNCPSAQELPIMVENAVASVAGVGEVKVNIVWDPPWDPSRMSDEARAVLNMW